MSAAAPLARDHLAVFDVDETLIRCKSMFSFLSFCYTRLYGQEAGCHAYMDFMEKLSVLAERLPREAVNRAYYRVFSGWPRNLVEQLAAEWFEQELHLGLFHEEVLAALRRHQHAGHQVALLSGSADFILAPLAAYVDADHVLAIHVGQTGDGVLTGEIDGIQTIGAGKRAALEALLDALPGRQPPVLHGYGDHESDAPFLARCDFKTVVLPPPGMAHHAPWAAGWDTLQLRPQRPSLPVHIAG